MAKKTKRSHHGTRLRRSCRGTCSTTPRPTLAQLCVMSARVGYSVHRDGLPSPLCQRTLQHTDKVLGLARDLVPRGAVSPPLNGRRQHPFLGSSTPPRRSTCQGISKSDARPSSSPLRSYAKGKNSLWLLNSESYSSATMRMLIEKQVAVAANRLKSPSRLGEFAANSPPRQRTAKFGRSGSAGGRAPAAVPDGRGAGGTASPACHANTGGGVSLAELASTSTAPRARGGEGTRTRDGIGVSVEVGGGREARRSLAQETYTKTFSGMQAYGESGMTVLEELIDAAFRACDMGHTQGQQRVTGAALLTRSGKIFSGYNVESASVDLSVGAERTTMLKAISEGETRFTALAMASDTDQAFPSPDGPGRQFLAEFGEFPVYLVNRDMQVKIVSTGELYPMMPPGCGLGPGRTRDDAVVAASREWQRRSPREWGVHEVLDWLEDELELGEYRREFARAKVDGTLLLNLEDTDVKNMLGITHPLHRRRVCLGIQKLKDPEVEEAVKGYVSMDDFVRHLDRDRIRLITKLKVVFDRFDEGGTGSLSALDCRAALEYMGRDVTGEGCASWLANKGRNEGEITFVDFTTAYSALFEGEDPDIQLGDGSAANRKGSVSVTGSGHVRLKQKSTRDGPSGTDEWRDTDERGLWAGSSDGDEKKSRARRESPRKARSVDDKVDNGGEERDGQAFEALRSVKKLAEVKRVFDRFAVDGMLTANEALQALTEAGCTAPRTHVGRYLRSRRFFGLRREVTFFEFLRSMAALGLQDSGAHVAGFATSSLNVHGTGWKSGIDSGRWGRRRRRDASRRNDNDVNGGRRNSRGRDARDESHSSDAFDYDEDSLSEEIEDESTYNDDIARRRNIRARKCGRADSRADSSSAEASTARSRQAGIRERRGSKAASPTRKGPDRRVASPTRHSSKRSGRELDRHRGRIGDDSSEKSSGRSRAARREDGRGDRSRSRERGNKYSGRSRDSRRRGTSESGGDTRGSYESVGDHRHRRAGHDSDDSLDRRNSRAKGASSEARPSGERDRGDDDIKRERDGDIDRERPKYREGPGDRENRDGYREPARDKTRGGSAWGKVKDSARAGSDGGGRAPPRGGVGTAKLREGDRVEAKYRGKGTKFYEGKIVRVNADGTFDIHYNDGDKELGISEEHVKLLEAPAAGCDRENAAGDKFSAGNVVEAKYRGKGIKYYKGKISRVNSDGTLDIAYDDGDKEVGIKEEHVRSLEPTVRSTRSRDHDKGERSLQEGDEVEGNYRARGRYYKGRISRVNLDGTFNVDYDDGEKEQAVTNDLIRRIQSGANPHSSQLDAGRSGRGTQLRKGDKVEARYRGRGTKFYKGKIARVNSDNTFDVDYDDGEKERGIAAEHVVSLAPASSADDSGGREGIIKEGDKIEGNYKGRGRYYRGQISRVNLDGTFNIDYDDGEEERGVTDDLIRRIKSDDTKGSGRVTLHKGDRVEARCCGKGDKFYKGKIARVHSDATLDINFDNGEKELGIAAEHVIPHEPGVNRDIDKGHSSPKLCKGDRVEARYRGRGTTFYKGEIARVNSDGTFDIKYDDGEKGNGISEEHVKSLENDSSGRENPGRENRGRSKPARGDKVEARYRGTSTKFYKGKIVRVNSDGTFDIDYDDGEKEIGLAEEHIKSLESASNEGRGDNEKALKFREGDKVEADFRGGGRYFKGRIGRINIDGTFSIDYDDGEKERGVPLALIRAPKERDDGGKFTRGSKVEARYRGRGNKFYEGTIVRVTSDGTFDIDYNDGDKERSIAAEHVRSLEHARTERDGRERDPALREGDQMEANYRGRGRYCKGRIKRVNSDGTLDIDYDDGEKERGVFRDMIRVSAASGGADRTGAKLIKGDVVEARYRGKGTKFYKGKIVRVNSDGTFDIDYDDGEKERGIAEDHVKPMDSDDKHERDENRKVEPIQEGDSVEVNYRGRGRHYKGRVRRAHRDGTFDIDFDDGEKERNVEAGMVRTLNGIASAIDRDKDSRGMFTRGDRVEARYRGRGTKFYKGRIVRANSDATFDIDYDDGEKEVGLAEEHVRSLEPEPRTGAPESRRESTVFHESDEIESNYRGRGRYYKGRISRTNLDGTFNIDYDDGEEERGVAKEMIRSLGKGGGESPSSKLRSVASRLFDKAGDGGRGRQLVKGDIVEARHRGKGTKYYRGKIVRVNSDATFDIDYDDGDKERGIAEEHVKSLESENTRGDERTSVKAPPVSLQKGDKVEAKYRGKGSKYFAGKVARVNSDDTFDITYDDGDKDVGLAAEHVRPRHPESRNPRKTSPDEGGATRFYEDDKVECNLRGRGRYYKGRIKRVNSDGTFDIQYSDGESERNVDKSMIRGSADPDDRVTGSPRSTGRKGSTKDISPRSSGRHRESGNSKLEKGDKVEARYRGRGTKFYKGCIVRVNSDDTFDIDYDDGEKEVGLAEEHIRSHEAASSEARQRAREGDEPPRGEKKKGAKLVLAEGDRIEANYRGKNRYYKGRISRCNLDGTFNIDYDDGEKERGVVDEMIRLLDGVVDSGASAHRRGANDAAATGVKAGDKLRRGDRVEARYRGRGAKFYKGRIARVNPDATLDIDYDDGDKEVGIAEEHVRQIS